jgi:hypothetical protein
MRGTRAKQLKKDWIAEHTFTKDGERVIKKGSPSYRSFKRSYTNGENK